MLWVPDQPSRALGKVPLLRGAQTQVGEPRAMASSSGLHIFCFPNRPSLCDWLPLDRHLGCSKHFPKQGWVSDLLAKSMLHALIINLGQLLQVAFLGQRLLVGCLP